MRTERQTDGWTKERMDGQTDRHDETNNVFRSLRTSLNTIYWSNTYTNRYKGANAETNACVYVTVAAIFLFTFKFYCKCQYNYSHVYCTHARTHTHLLLLYRLYCNNLL